MKTQLLRLVLLLMAAISIAPSASAAQQTASTPDSAAFRRNPLARFGKWATLAGAFGAATYGVLANQEADNRYADLERTCQDEPARCERVGNGRYADALLEAEYQRVLKLDNRAQIALVAGEISVLASVMLFVLDLPRGRTGEDIPYSPPRFQVKPDGDRLLLSFRLNP